MDSVLPLPSLLSQALVAFTVEFDNEAERRTPHRTTNHGASALAGVPRPWLVSMVMWSNCMRYVDDHGITVRELERRARTPTNLAGMQRWGYVVVDPGPAGRPGKRAPKWSWVVRPTPSGSNVKRICEPLFAEIEQRWENRFGAPCLARLRSALEAIAGRLEGSLPDCMPILGYGMDNAPRLTKLAPADVSPSRLSLVGLVAKVLLSFALAFELESEVSLAICANVLRILDQTPVPVRDLPTRSGVSREALAMATGVLAKRNLVLCESQAAQGSPRTVRLTPLGAVERGRYRARLAEIEKEWQGRFGAGTIGHLRNSLEELVGDATPSGSPLFGGIEPHPDGWRAQIRRPSTLPHFPMVLHRGGFPDGS